jgi:hypothetical protein
MRIAAWLAASIVVCAAIDGRAQTTVGGIAGASRQQDGLNDLPRLGPPIGGTTAAFVAMIDRPIKRRLSIGGEASLSGSLSGDQSQRTSTSTYAFTSRHRDTVFSGVLKAGTPVDGRLHLALAAGAGLAYRRTARDGTVAPLFPPSTRSPYSDVIGSYVFAYTLGGDVDLRVTDRIRVLAIARWHRLRDDDLDADGAVKRGISSTIFRAGAGLKYRF